MSTEQEPPASSEESSNARWFTVPLGGAIVVAIAVLFLHGNLDRTLYPVGLNYHECARNGLGATFCGKELDEYRARVEAIKVKGQEAQTSLEESEKRSEERAETEKTDREYRERQDLEGKLAREKRLTETEPSGSFGYDLAVSEYEATRAEINQLRAQHP